MKHSGKMLVCLGSLAACALARGVPAEAPDNPYQSIIDRNVFSLKPPPPPPDPTEANKPQVVKITLTGITTILGNKRVLMKAAPPQAKPGEAPKTEQSYILTEGQRDGDIEVIQIDDKAGSVKVNNGGTVQTLTFEKDGAKLPSTPSPAMPGIPGAPQIPGLPVVRPGTTPNFQLPTRLPRLPMPGAQASSGAPGVGVAAPNYGTPGFLPGNTATPLLQNSGAVPSQTQTILPGGNLTAEEQAIMIEVNRQAGGPGAAMLPPTMLTPKPTQQGTTTPGGNGLQLPSFPGRPLPPGPF
jgi:hypothetical protein